MRIMGFRAKAFREVRGVACADVAQRTVADLTLNPLAHLHPPGARFHARRATGVINRGLAQGATAVGFLRGAARFAMVLAVIQIG